MYPRKCRCNRPEISQDGYASSDGVSQTSMVYYGFNDQSLSFLVWNFWTMPELNFIAGTGPFQTRKQSSQFFTQDAPHSHGNQPMIDLRKCSCLGSWQPYVMSHAARKFTMKSCRRTQKHMTHDWRFLTIQTSESHQACLALYQNMVKPWSNQVWSSDPSPTRNPENIINPPLKNMIHDHRPTWATDPTTNKPWSTPWSSSPGFRPHGVPKSLGPKCPAGEVSNFPPKRHRWSKAWSDFSNGPSKRKGS